MLLCERLEKLEDELEDELEFLICVLELEELEELEDELENPICVLELKELEEELFNVASISANIVR
jgi:hypothetical protein